MRTFFILLLSCLSCSAQFVVQQPFLLTVAASEPMTWPSATALLEFESTNFVFNAANTLATDGQEVKSWQTNSGYSGWDLTNLAGTGYRGVFQTSDGPNGRPYIRFPSPNGNLSGMTNRTSSEFTQPLLVCMVVRKLPQSSSSNVRELFDGYSKRLILGQQAPADLSPLYVYGGTASMTGPTNSFVTNIWYLVSAYFAGTNSYIRTNGVTFFTNATAIGTGNLQGLCLACAPSPNFPAYCDVASLRVFGSISNAIASNDVRNIERFIGSMNGITIP